MTILTLKLPEALNTKLDSYAQKKGLNKSELVRIALIEYLAKVEVNTANSFTELAKDLAGSVDGPADLSANKSYFNDYGK